MDLDLTKYVHAGPARCAGTVLTRARSLAAWAMALTMALAPVGAAWAQTAPARKALPAAQRAQTQAKPAGAVASAPVATPRAGKGWQVGAMPAWVVSPPAPPEGLAAAPATGARREQLVDFQAQHGQGKPQIFVRVRTLALDATALGEVSQPQISFNPAFQTVRIHHAVVLRGGQRSERLADARIEPMRREQRLEQQVIDGNETLLVVLNDVRVGDAVELAYTLEGENPLFEKRISWSLPLAYETPVDLLHMRLTAPAGRTLRTLPQATTLQPERLLEGDQQVLRVVRHQVSAIAREQHTPPWVKVFPAIDISEYTDWAEVDAWAQRLFALPSPTPPEVAAKAAALRATGLQGEALVSETLRFVQDEVRYFSVALGESSHRPKPPQQTLADLVGDCKDKVTLLNTLLRELGFDAKPALVSMRRNRGINEFLPSHDLFDHVITALDLAGKRWYLDATINGQGFTLASRGQVSYGSALVVGDGAALQAVPEPPVASNRVEFEQRWNLSEPGKPTPLTTVLRAHGLLAEGWRAALGRMGSEQISQGLSGGFARILPGLKPLGPAEVADDRRANVFEYRQHYTLDEFGSYNRGAVEAEFLALELLDVLTGPADTQRRTPYLVDQPRQVDSRIVVTAPTAFTVTSPAPLEVVDRQFRYTVRLELQGPVATYTRRYERRQEQVAPAELQAWREKILRARETTAGRLRLPLLDSAQIVTDLQALERRLRNARGWRNDTLQEILVRNEFGRHLDTQVLAKVPVTSALAAKALASRALANNLLGDFGAGQTDADAALAVKADDATALEARAVALLGLGRAEEALASFARITPQARTAAISSWMGAVQLYLGRAAEAETLLRDAVANGSGDEREFALLWLYLAAERQGGRGREAIAEHVDATDAKKLTGAMLRHLVGTFDRDGLLRQAAEKPAMERLNLAEAHFFIGQRLLAQGQRDDALRHFQRTVDTGATPYREVSFARLELMRAAK